MWLGMLLIAAGVLGIALGIWTAAIGRRSSGKPEATDWASHILGGAFVLLGVREAFRWHAPARITLTSLGGLLLVISMTLNVVALLQRRRLSRDA